MSVSFRVFAISTAMALAGAAFAASAAPATTAAKQAAAKTETAAKKPLTTQQQRMKDCNAEAKAKSLKKDARKTFMSSCLKGKGSAKAAAPAAK